MRFTKNRLTRRNPNPFRSLKLGICADGVVLRRAFSAAAGLDFPFLFTSRAVRRGAGQELGCTPVVDRHVMRLVPDACPSRSLFVHVAQKRKDRP